MVRSLLGTTAVLLASAPAVLAGALDRSGQPVGVIFEPGNYVELSFGYTMPTVEGTHTTPFGTSRSGDAGEAYGQGVVAAKFDANEQLSFAIIYDQPFGADVDYGDADPTYPIAGSRASFESSGITALGRYRFNENFSVHAGARMVQIDADLFVRSIAAVTPTGPVFATYEASFEPDRDIGFVVGAAYEKPEIALRVALTYSSEMNFENDYRYTVSSPLGTASGTGTTRYTMPQSVNLDFRTGIAENTLLFGSIRWADWSETVIELDNYLTGRPVVDFEGDYFTYTIGVGRRFTEQFAGSASIIYEPGIASDFDPATGEGGVSNLSPVDGQLGLQVTGTYYVSDALEVTGAVRYTRLGDSTTERVGAVFEGNDALTVGVRVGYRF
jgi:long-chain fatty acid transport protein